MAKKSKVRSRVHALKQQAHNRVSERKGYKSIEHPINDIYRRIREANKPRVINAVGTALLSSLFEEFAYLHYIKKEFADDAKSTRLRLGDYVEAGCLKVSGKVSEIRKFGDEWKVLLTTPTLDAQAKGVSYDLWSQRYDNGVPTTFIDFDESIVFDSHIWVSVRGLDIPLKDEYKLPLFVGDRITLITEVAQYKSGVTHRYGLSHKLTLIDAIHPVYTGVKTVESVERIKGRSLDKNLARLAGSITRGHIVTSKSTGGFVWAEPYTVGVETHGLELGHFDVGADGKGRFHVNKNRNNYIPELEASLEEGISEEKVHTILLKGIIKDWLYKLDKPWVTSYMYRLRKLDHYGLLYPHICETGVLPQSVIDKGIFKPNQQQLELALHLAVEHIKEEK